MNDAPDDSGALPNADPSAGPDHEDPRIAVTRLLDEAVARAQEAGMATSDLLGIFHYYAHCIAASYRESTMCASPDDDPAAPGGEAWQGPDAG